MHWTRVSLLCLVATVFASTRPVSAQVTDDTSGVVSLDDFSGSMSLGGDGGTYFQFNRWSGHGVGIQGGYTNLGFRGKLLDLGESHFFTELNGLISDHSRLGASLGGGFRTLYDNGVLGTHAWYDHYESQAGNKYSQAVLGAEYLHRWMDVRVNGYMPFGDRENFTRLTDLGTEPVFFGNDFGTIGTGEFERSLAGADFEGGVPLPRAEFIRLFGGGYFLTAKGDDTWGVRSRIEARVAEGINLSFNVSDDDRFGTNLNFNATIWTGPGVRTTRFMRDMNGWSRRYDPVRRANLVQLALDKDDVNVPLVNAETGQRFNIVWVDNDATAPGDGTFENPFTELPATVPGASHVLVRRGDGGPTLGNITLDDNTHMWGEGRQYTLHTVRLGDVIIPDQFFDHTGTAPNLLADDPNQPIVTLADNNEVINFNMFGGPGGGIFGQDIRDFFIDAVNIDANSGIIIDNADGRGIIQNSVVTAGFGTGIFVSNTGGGRLDLDVTNVDIDGGAIGMQIYSEQSIIQANVSDFTTDNNSNTGVIFNEFQGFLFANVTDAQVLNSGGLTNNGFELRAANGGQLSVEMSNVSARGDGDLFAINSNTATVTTNVINADFSESTAGSGVTINGANSLVTANFTDLTAADNLEDGLRIAGSLGSQINVAVINSILTGNGDDNFDVSVASGADVNLFVDPTDASQSVNDNAFEFFVTDAGSTLDATFIDVDLSQAGNNAISGLIDNGGRARLDLVNVIASDSGFNGLDVTVTDESDFVAVVRNSTFERSGVGNLGTAINLVLANGSTADIDLDNTPASGNGARGFNFDVTDGAAGGSRLIASVSFGDFSDNPLNNVAGNVSGAGSQAILLFNNVVADNLASLSGVDLTAELGGRIDVDWSGDLSSISNTTANGVELTSTDPGSIINFNFAGGAIDDNAFNGVLMNASNDGLAAASFTDTTITGSGFENVRANAVTGGDILLSVVTSDLSGGGLAGAFDNLRVDSTGAGSNANIFLDAVDLDDSTQNGIQFIATGLGSIFAELSSNSGVLTASNNPGAGLRVQGTGADRLIVLSDGANAFNDNGGDGADIDILTANLAVIGLGGGGSSFDGNGGDGINIQMDNVTVGAISITGPSSASNNAGDGIEVDVSNSTLANVNVGGQVIPGLRIDGVTVAGNGGDAINVHLDNTILSGDGEISNNDVSGGADGIVLDVDGNSVVNLAIHDNNITNYANNGIIVNLNDTVFANRLNIDGNNVDGGGLSSGDGIRLNVLDNATLSNGTINDNDVASNNGAHGIHVNVDGAGIVDVLDIVGNTTDNNGFGGILYSAASGTSLTTLVIGDNDVADNGGNGIDVLLDTVLGNPDIVISENVVANSTGLGINVFATDTSIEDVVMDDNTVSLSQGGDGIHFEMVNPSGAATLLSLGADGNTVVTSAGTGMNFLLDSLDTSAIIPSISITNSIVDDSQGLGIAVTALDMSVNNVLINGATLTDNIGGDGIFINLDNQTGAARTAHRVEVVNASIDNSGGSGISALFTNMTFTNRFLVDGVSATNNTGGGLSLLASNSPIPLVSVTDSAFSNNTGGDGVLISLVDSGVNQLIVQNNNIDGNAANGVNVDADNSPLGSVLISDNRIGIGLGGGAGIDDSLPVIRGGFNGNTLGPLDDVGSIQTPLGFTANFFGQIFTDAFVNNNGNITFNAALSTFTPFDLLSTATPIIAPFFADVDTQAHGNTVTFGQGTIAGRNAFAVNWLDVDYFNSDPAHGNQLNDFQLVLIDRSDIAPGDFDIEFNYGTILWETGDASGGTDGLGGDSARAGFSNGVNASFELAGSAINGAFLDSGPAATSLVQNMLNSANAGRYVFFARAGGIGGANGNADDGVRFNVTNGSNVGAMEISSNEIANSGQHGIELIVEDSTLPTAAAPIVVANNDIHDHANGDGIRMILPDTNGTGIGMDLIDNDISNNAGGAGVNIQIDENAASLTSNITGNTVNNNGNEGFDFNVSSDAGPVLLDIQDFSGNTVNTNGDMGVRIETTTDPNVVGATVQVNFNAGLTADNVIDGNNNAGIGLDLNQRTQADVFITDTIISNTINNGDPDFSGDGFAAHMHDNATLAAVIQASAITNNDGHGIRASVTGDNLASFSVIESFRIGGATPELGNLIEGNGLNGIDFLRTADGRIGTVAPVTIQNNLIQNNAIDGIHLSSRNAFMQDRFVIADNGVFDNGGDGMHFDVQADAEINVNVLRNDIDGNTGNGILTTEEVNFPTDNRFVSGIWQENFITNNTLNGIDISSATSNLLVGSTNNIALGNVIMSNGLDGVNIAGAGTSVWGNNLVADNAFHGFEIHAAAFKDTTLVANHITNNGFGPNLNGEVGDGVEFNNNSGAQMNLRLFGNTIDFNAGRGIDILNQGDSFSFVNIGVDGNTGLGNVVNANGGEGIYIVNTASTTQNQSDPTPEDGITPNVTEGVGGTDQPVTATAHKGMNRDGAIDNNAFLNIIIDNATVIGNGQNSGFQATGIVTRVGTTGGGYGAGFGGGFATSGFGGVVMELTDSELGGNFGDDLFFESFTSTNNPVDTAGTWTIDTNDPANNVFQIDNYQGDALARLDLTYRNNVRESALITAQGAYYDNAEGVFKSRLNNIAAPNLPGPFPNAARRRNAQRIGDRVYPDGTVLPPAIDTDPGPGVVLAPHPTGAGFLYPGMGDSTFRLNLANSDDIFSLAGDGFLIDNFPVGSPIQNPGDMNGTFYPIGGNTQQSPWGWGTF